MLKELGHFLRRDFTKGSEGEIKDKELRLEHPEKAKEYFRTNIYYL